tara:strand:+ start:30579 stop:31844 length:1266 start_codon:yes stop_codon:yes gene_type:complete
MNDLPDCHTDVQAIVIGAGPAGLMAAEALADCGHQVIVADAKPTAGRKFLMAGKSGLNITKDTSDTDLLAAYGPDAAWIAPLLADFGSDAVKQWAQDLGQDVFTGSSGRVFPTTMKSSPLLRAWLRRLADKNVQLKTRWRWQGWEKARTQTDTILSDTVVPETLVFETPQGRHTVTATATVLALGGSSWSRLGSDGKWTAPLSAAGVSIVPFQPANMGFVVEWSDYMRPHFGAAIKPLRLTAGDTSVMGEMIISQRGIEGGGVYAVSRAMREGAPLVLDLIPDVSAETLDKRMAKLSGKASRSSVLRKAFGFGPAKSALINEFARAVPVKELARAVKALTIDHAGPRPIDEAISTAGGIAKDVLDETLMLRAKPGVFCAGEMIDWEAPTGGYLITAALATGRAAGQAAAKFIDTSAAKRAE